MVQNISDYRVVSGIFDSRDEVESLLAELERKEISRDQIDVIMTDKTKAGYADLEGGSKAAEGTAVGGVSGGLLGALIGGLTLVGSLAIPGSTLLLTGPIVGALAGGLTGATAGSLAGALVGAGIPEEEAKFHEQALQKEGNVLIIAHVDKDDVLHTKGIFKQYGAQDLNVDAEQPVGGRV